MKHWRGWGAAGLAASAVSLSACSMLPGALRPNGAAITLRDGVRLHADVYLPRGRATPAPCILTVTPYLAESYAERGSYFATHGLPFVAVDVRGRGQSGGTFAPIEQEARDGYDIVEWLAKQPYCNGKVATWGGSYAGYTQWATAKEFPPHLATLVPVAAPAAGVDFPLTHNTLPTYIAQWLTYTDKTARDPQFDVDSFWPGKFRQWFEGGLALKDLDTLVGHPSKIFQHWVEHPHLDAYWDSLNPTPEQYARLSLPILSITGAYDGDQEGALAHYQRHMSHASAANRARHFLIIGPWDHPGTRNPQLEFHGLKVGPASLLDMQQLHLDWYAWTMQGGDRPAFLKNNVAYYVIGADRWRYSDSLAAVTTRSEPYYLGNGTLGAAPASSAPSEYTYDPRDVALAEIDAELDPEAITDTRLLQAQAGRQLRYRSAPFVRPTEISGFFKLSAWLAIDQPDTDFKVSIYEERADGSSLKLSSDLLRARYRQDPRQPMLITTRSPLRYDFENFTFIACQLQAGSRLLLILGPNESIYSDKNYNSGGIISQESMRDARPVRVALHHGPEYPSVLSVPFGHAD